PDKNFPVYNIITNDDSGYVCNGIVSATEISVKLLFAKSPAVKGMLFNEIFKRRTENEKR
ncbi:MAG: hypothetical protein K2P92_05440, partial [Bdellovibrionaceae bacterium]|nr:hypothetical protein [Pseudobdellovibrionaceae bacterium]